MPFLAQVGHEHSFLPELITNGDLEGVILQISRGGPTNISEVAARGGMVLVDPQTYKLGDANVALTAGFAKQDFVDAWPGVPALSNRDRRLAFVQSVIDAQKTAGATEVITPYLYIEDASGPALDRTLEMAEDATQLVDGSVRLWTGLYVAGAELKRQRRVDDLLNRITSSTTNHCYLVVDPEHSGCGPLADADLVIALRQVVRALESNDIRVVLGYSDPLGLLLMADGLSGFASGITASLRGLTMASQRRRSGGGRTPHARYYTPLLLNFLRVDTELRPALARLAAAGGTCRCRYCARNLPQLTATGAFNRSDGNRHYLASLTAEAQTLASASSADRRASTRTRIERALQGYETLYRAGIQLEGDSGSSHLRAWERAFNQ